MTDEFQKGLITGLAMQPLQVTTEHAAPDPSGPSAGGDMVIGGWSAIFENPIIIGEILTIRLNTTEGS